MRKHLDPKSNCVDVGAYRGEILKQIKSIARQGKHFAFEPILENYNYLKNNFPDASIHNVALSNRTGQASFQHVIGRPARSGLEKQSYPNPNEEVNEITVRTAKLDDVVPDSTEIDFIKVDVEGAELQVFQGAEQVIRKHKPLIIFEHTPEYSRSFDVEPKDVHDFLVGECGLNIATMGMWLSGADPYSKKQFLDAALSRREFQFLAY